MKAMESRLSLPQLAPSDHEDSYSKLSTRTAYLPWVSTSFLQATGQAWQVGSLTRMVSLTFSPEISLAVGKLVAWAVRVGKAPTTLARFIRLLVPSTERPPFRGDVALDSSMMAARARERASLEAALSFGLGGAFLALMTTPFSFWLPPTAPVPPRPDARSFSLMKAA